MRSSASIPVLFAALAALPAARAEDTSDLEGLLEQPVISTASKSAETASSAPAVSSTITAEDLRRYGIESLDQALDFLSLGMVTESDLATSEVGARGVLLTRDYGSHVLLLVDGHALNEQWNGTAYFDRGAAIPMELVDHIEVILGPGSVLYGSNAMLGVINVVTKRAKDFDGYHAVLSSELPGAVRGSLALGRGFELLGERGEAVVSVEYRRAEGPDLFYGTQQYGEDAVTGEPRRFGFGRPGTGVWGGTAGDALASEVPVVHGRLSLGDFSLTARAASYRRSVPHSWGNFDDPGSYERDRWLTLDARWDADLSTGFDLSLRAYGDVYDYLQNARSAAAETCLDGQLEGCVYRLYGASRWAGLESILRYDWLHDARFVTLAGVDARGRFVKAIEEYLDAATDASTPGGDLAPRWERTVGAYLEQTLRPWAWLGLNAGARLDWDEGYGTNLSPRLAASLSPWDGGTLKAIYATAFRAPTAFECYYADPMAVIAAPDLVPERVRSAELAVEQRLGAQRLTVGLFRSWWSEMVVYGHASPEEVAAAQASGQLDASLTEAYRYSNVASVENYGVNLGVEGSFLSRRLRYGLAATVAHAALDSHDGLEPAALMAAAQLFGNARLSWEAGGYVPVVALAARFAGARPVADTGFAPAPLAPAQTELRLTFSGDVPGVAGLSYRISGQYGAANRGPYSVGPLFGPSEGYTEAALLPLPQWAGGIGLQYDLK